MAKIDLRYGDEVLIPWGPATEVRGTVQEIYGPPARRHVLVLLTPELTEPWLTSRPRSRCRSTP
jgi:hypothetical protein